MLRDRNTTNKQALIADVGDYVAGLIVTFLPHVSIFNRLKSAVMRIRGATVGKRVKILSGVWIDRFAQVEIGDDVSLARGVIIVAAGGVIIGERTMIGYGTKILTANHKIPAERMPIRFAGADLKFTTIEKDVWVGANVVILPGVTIGEASVIGAGAVVTKDIPPYSVAVGVPALVIKKR